MMWEYVQQVQAGAGGVLRAYLGAASDAVISRRRRRHHRDHRPRHLVTDYGRCRSTATTTPTVLPALAPAAASTSFGPVRSLPAL